MRSKLDHSTEINIEEDSGGHQYNLRPRKSKLVTISKRAPNVERKKIKKPKTPLSGGAVL